MEQYRKKGIHLIFSESKNNSGKPSKQTWQQRVEIISNAVPTNFKGKLSFKLYYHILI